MNTIFKFYYQVWLIWGVLAAYALWALFQHGWTTARRALVVITLLIAGVLLVGGLLYPYFTFGRLLSRTPAVGLVGKTPRERTNAGVASIQWLRDNTNGRDIILEASASGAGQSYDPDGTGIGGVSAGSGLATVLGWPGHENQWRGGDPTVSAKIEPRRVDVDTIYSSTDANQARALLEQYGVDYVYIGAAERSRYGQASLDKFAQLGRAVFQQDEVVIYAVGQ